MNLIWWPGFDDTDAPVVVPPVITPGLGPLSMASDRPYSTALEIHGAPIFGELSGSMPYGSSLSGVNVYSGPLQQTREVP